MNTKTVHRRGVINDSILGKLQDNTIFYDMTGKGIFMGCSSVDGKYVGPVKIAGSEDGCFISKRKLRDYLYELEYRDFDYESVEEFFEKRSSLSSQPGCSSIREGKFLCRNFDWYYSNNAEFVIVAPHTNKHFKSVGIVGNIEPLESDFIESYCYSELYKVLPFLTVDGINENGVAVSSNVTSIYDGPLTTGTNPGKPRMCGCVIPRYILDKHSNAHDAVYDVADNWDIYLPHNKNFNEEMHFIIADKDETYILEFKDNRAVILKDGDSPVVRNKRAWMTNFKVCQTSFNSTGIISDWSTVEAHGAGLERSDSIANFLKDITVATEVDILHLLESIKYSQAYELQTSDGLPQWKTELCGIYSQEDLRVTDPVKKFKRVFDIMKDMYVNRDRKNPVTWQTVHSSIYDLENKSLTLFTQEDFMNSITYTCRSDWEEMLDNPDFIASLKNKLGL